MKIRKIRQQSITAPSHWSHRPKFLANRHRRSPRLGLSDLVYAIIFPPSSTTQPNSYFVGQHRIAAPASSFYFSDAAATFIFKAVSLTVRHSLYTEALRAPEANRSDLESEKNKLNFVLNLKLLLRFETVKTVIYLFIFFQFSSNSVYRSNTN